MEIANATIVVTGASSGIGAATARAAGQAGARVVLAARREDRIAALAEELGDAIAVRCDVTNPGQVAALADAAVERFGGVDVLVNNAGQGLQATIGEIERDDFRAILELNLIAPLTALQTVLPIMRRQGGGAVVNVSSGVTLGAIPGTGAYAASKYALEKLMEIAREELADAGIVVSTLLPFVTDTEFIDSLRAGHEAGAELESSHAPQPRTPEETAEAILALIRSGDERADLVPVAFGGSVEP